MKDAQADAEWHEFMALQHAGAHPGVAIAAVGDRSSQDVPLNTSPVREPATLPLQPGWGPHLPPAAAGAGQEHDTVIAANPWEHSGAAHTSPEALPAATSESMGWGSSDGVAAPPIPHTAPTSGQPDRQDSESQEWR